MLFLGPFVICPCTVFFPCFFLCYEIISELLGKISIYMKGCIIWGMNWIRLWQAIGVQANALACKFGAITTSPMYACQHWWQGSVGCRNCPRQVLYETFLRRIIMPYIFKPCWILSLIVKTFKLVVVGSMLILTWTVILIDIKIATLETFLHLSNTFIDMRSVTTHGYMASSLCIKDYNHVYIITAFRKKIIRLPIAE